MVCCGGQRETRCVNQYGLKYGCVLLALMERARKACCCSWHTSQAGDTSASCWVTAGEESMQVLTHLVSMHSGFKEEGKGPWKQRIAYVLSLNLVFLSWRYVAQGGSSLRCHWLCCSTATGICCRSLDNSKHSVPWMCSGRLQQLLFDWVVLGVWSEKHKAPLLEIKHALQKPAPSHGCYFIGL